MLRGGVQAASMRRYKTINLPECRRGRDRPKKSRNDVIKYDVEFIGSWRSKTKVVDH